MKLMKKRKNRKKSQHMKKKIEIKIFKPCNNYEKWLSLFFDEKTL